MNNKGTERRLFPRKLVRTKVTFDDEFGEGLISLYAEDISMGGLYISSDIPIRVGSYVFLSFSIPGSGKTIRATGQIVRVSKSKEEGVEKRSGMGVRFVGLSAESAQLLQEFIL